MEKLAEDALALRQRAEKALVHLTGLAKIDVEAGPTAIRELRLHQIELEMQNQALRDAQFELDRSRQQYRQLCDGAPFPYLRLSSDTAITYANAAAQRLLGAQAIGKRFSTFINPPDAVHFALHRREADASESARVIDLRLLIDGEPRQMRLHSSRLAQSEDDLLVAIVDVGAQLHFEQGLQEYAFASAVLSAAGLLVVIDGSGNIVRVNERCAQALGGARSLLLRPFAEVFAAPSQREMVRSKLTATCNQGRGQTFESSLGDDALQSLWISWTSVLLTTGGAAGHVLVTGTDVTERRRLQQQLLLADRLAAVGTLAAGMAHEINNPLGYVMGSIAVAKRMLATQGTDTPQYAKIQERLAAIQEGSERIRDIVDNLRAFCREEPVVLESVDVRSVLETSLKLAQNDIRHRARLVKSCEDVPRVHASARRLAQVFLNLIANAAHAIAPGNADSHRITVRVYENEGWVCVDVEDTGHGIAPKDLQHVFDPFFTTKLAGAGMGLGLSVCHSIISECGGRIEVESTQDQGSVFRVFLPVADEVADGDGPARTSGVHPVYATPEGTETPLRVLVVDDEPQLARTLACMLSDEHVQVVHSGKQALAACQRSNFDLILCDLLMPQMTGLELYGALHAVSPELQGRVVFMTGCLNDLDDLPAPLAEVLHKPFSFDDLNRVVDEHRRRRRDAANFASESAAE